MIKKIGVDIVNNRRIERIYKNRGKAFLERVLTANESSLFFDKNESIAFLSGRWAAKEAVGKSLGQGLKCGLKNIEVLNDESGAPYVVLHKRAKKAAKELNITRIEVSISHEKENTVAFVVTL